MTQQAKITDPLRDCVAELYCRKVSLSHSDDPELMAKVNEFRSHMEADVMPIRDLSDLEVLRFAMTLLDQLDSQE